MHTCEEYDFLCTSERWLSICNFFSFLMFSFKWHSKYDNINFTWNIFWIFRIKHNLFEISYCHKVRFWIIFVLTVFPVSCVSVWMIKMMYVLYFASKMIPKRNITLLTLKSLLLNFLSRHILWLRKYWIWRFHFCYQILCSSTYIRILYKADYLVTLCYGNFIIKTS